MSWDGRPGQPCSDAWGQNGEHTDKSWKDRGDMLREDLADWESTGGDPDTWFEDRGLGDYRRMKHNGRY